MRKSYHNYMRQSQQWRDFSEIVNSQTIYIPVKKMNLMFGFWPWVNFNISTANK